MTNDDNPGSGDAFLTARIKRHLRGYPAAVTTLDRKRIQREREVENALASVRMEGLEPSEEAKGIFQRYAEGDLTLNEMAAP
jgi:hypothetical protein